MIDTSRTIEIDKSWRKIVGILAGGIVLSVGSVAIAFHWIGDTRSGSFIEFIGFVGAIMFPACCVFILWQAFHNQGSTVSLSPAGLRDVRLAPDLIPWSAITGITTWELHKTKTLVLTLDPGALAHLHPKLGAKIRRSGAFGTPKGLFIASNSLAISFDELLDLVLSYHSDHHLASGDELAITSARN